MALTSRKPAAGLPRNSPLFLANTEVVARAVPETPSGLSGPRPVPAIRREQQTCRGMV